VNGGGEGCAHSAMPQFNVTETVQQQCGLHVTSMPISANFARRLKKAVVGKNQNQFCNLPYMFLDLFFS
jgi:hypothetical protein